MDVSTKEAWFRFHYLLAKFSSTKLSAYERQDQESGCQRHSHRQIKSSSAFSKGVPPLEKFLDVPESVRQKKLYESLRIGDILKGKVTEKSSKGLFLKITKVLTGKKRLVRDLHLKGFCPVFELDDTASHTSDPLAGFDEGDVVRGAVHSVVNEYNPIELTLRNRKFSSQGFELGLVMSEDESDTCSSSEETSRCIDSPDFIKYLHQSSSFLDPVSMDTLKSRLDISSSVVSYLERERKYNFPLEEYADKLKESQSRKWSFDMVATGVRMFKEGRNSEALKCFNQSLNLCPQNVEAIVARGALKANQGNLKDSIQDFRKALELAPTHKNGRKYLVETLTSLGKRYEKDGKWKEASSCYKEVIELDPSYEDSIRRFRQITQLIREKTEASERKLNALPQRAETTAKEKETKNDKAVGYLKRLLEHEQKPLRKKNKKSKKSKKKKSGKRKKKRKRRYSSSDSDTEATASATDSDMTSHSEDEWVEKPSESEKSNYSTVRETADLNTKDIKGNPTTVYDTKSKERRHSALYSSADRTGCATEDVRRPKAFTNSQTSEGRKIALNQTVTVPSPSLSKRLRHFSHDEMNLVAELLQQETER